MLHIHLCICSFYRFLLFPSNPNGAHPNVRKSSAFCFHSWFGICIENKNANNIITITIHMCLVYVFVSLVRSSYLVRFIYQILSSSHLDCLNQRNIDWSLVSARIQVHERQINRMRTRSEWFLGCGDSLNSEMNLCVSGIQTNTVEDVSRGNYATDNLCDHNTNDSGSLRTGICMCAS